MSRYDGLIIPRSYSEYLNKTDSATLSQMLQHLTGLWSHAVSAGDQKPVTSDAVNGALANFINKTDAATLQQALQLPGVLSGAVAAGDNKAVKSSAVYDALKVYQKINSGSQITDIDQITNIDVSTLADNQNTFVVSGITINTIANVYGTAEIFKRANDISVTIHDTVHNCLWQNAKNSGNWSTWQQIATNSDLADYQTAKKNILSTSVDLNTLNTSGRYFAISDATGNNCTNKPTENVFAFFLEVLQEQDNGTTFQIMITGGGDRYIRMSYDKGNTWNEWKQ